MKLTKLREYQNKLVNRYVSVLDIQAHLENVGTYHS
jgi:hypothetical protein